MDSPWALSLICAAVVIGAALQRMTGMGFGSVLAPVLVLTVGAIEGVQWTNLLAATASLVILVALWRDIEPRRTALIGISALATTPLGVLLVVSLPGPAVLILVGVVMLAAVVSVAPLGRLRVMHGVSGALITGGLSGIANATAGLAGPLLGAYALVTRWNLRSYVASMQLCWFIVNVATLALKGLPPLAVNTTIALGSALAAGSILGHLLDRHVAPRAAEIALKVIAIAGAILLLVRGGLDLIPSP